MNILHVNTFDIRGGAARAAYRLNNALNGIGINSRMLVKGKKSTDKNVLQFNKISDDVLLNQSRTFKTITESYIRNNRTDLSDTLYSLGYPGYDLSKLDVVAKADVINLHWVSTFQSTESIYTLLKLNKPVVWTLHDENPYTGGCHYSAGCTFYKNECKECPQLTDDPFQLPFFNLRNKTNLLKNKNLTLVSPSKWLASKAKESAVFRDLKVVTIPNSIETDIFVPKNKKQTKKKLGIPEDNVTILIGISKERPRRKGFSEFLSAANYSIEDKRISQFVKEKKITFLCFGNINKELKNLKIPIKTLGHIGSDTDLSDIYSAADMFLLPSIEDNLPNTMLEAMSCGIPVISFNVGGMRDMIQNGVNGYLVPFLDCKAFSEAIVDLILNIEKRNKMGKKSRELIERSYKLEDQAKNYVELYLSLLQERQVFENFQIDETETCLLDSNKSLWALIKKYGVD